jgi:arginine exporter protein ArgO
MKRDWVCGSISITAFAISLVSPIIISPLIVLVGAIFAILEFVSGKKAFACVAFALVFLQIFSLAIHYELIKKPLTKDEKFDQSIKEFEQGIAEAKQKYLLN